MVIWVDWITIVISSILIVANWRKIALDSKYIVFFLFFLFYVFPIYLDCFFSPPQYTDWLGQGFTDSSCDFWTRVVYDIIIIIIQLLLLSCRKCIKNESGIAWNQLNNGISSGTKVALYLGMIMPTLITSAFSSHLFILYTPQWREIFDASVVARYTYFEKMSYITVACSLVLFFLPQKRNAVLHKIICILFLFTGVCVEGKRSIIFFAFLLVLLIKIPGLVDPGMPIKQRLKSLFRLTILGFISVAVMVGLTILVKIGSRGYDASNFSELYTAIRIDFLRDDRVRLAIYSFLNPSKTQILNTPFQTLSKIPLFLFPIDYILNMNHVVVDTYAKYLTSALLGIEHSAVMTPSMFAELISNLGYFGFLLMPLVCKWFARRSNNYGYPQNIFILTSFVLLQMYDFAYVAYFIEFTILLCIMNKVSMKKELLLQRN